MIEMTFRPAIRPASSVALRRHVVEVVGAVITCVAIFADPPFRVLPQLLRISAK